MVEDLNGLVVAVTGGTKGIGRAAVVKLVAAGARVVFQGRDEAAAAALLAKCAPLPGECAFVNSDLMTYAGIEAPIAEAVDRFGRIDVVVGSGGAREPRPKLFVDMAPDEGMAMVNSRLAPRVHALHAAVKFMRDQGRGKVILITTDAGRIPTPSESMVGAAGAAVIFLTQALAAELGRLGIRVNAIATTLTTGTPPYDAYLEALEQGSNAVLVKAFKKVEGKVAFRVNSAEDLADYVIFLAGPGSDQISGSTMSINGGLSFPKY